MLESTQAIVRVIFSLGVDTVVTLFKGLFYYHTTPASNPGLPLMRKCKCSACGERKKSPNAENSPFILLEVMPKTVCQIDF